MAKIKAFLKSLFVQSEYISEIDRFIADFDKQHPKLSLSQRNEKDKYARIYRLRDITEQYEPKEKLWENF